MKKIMFIIMLSMTSFFNTFAQDTPAKVSEVGLTFSTLTNYGLRYKYGSDNTLLRLTALVFNGSNLTSDYTNYTVNGVNYEPTSSPANSLGAGLNIGFEKRKSIGDKLYFYYGLDLISSFNQSNNNNTAPFTSTYNATVNNVYTQYSAVLNNYNSNNSKTISSGLGIVLGIARKINDSFSISAELLPSVLYKYTNTNTTNTSYSVNWVGSSSTGYTASPFVSNNTNQTIITKGFTYGFTNSSASITLAYKIK
jgi:hypothetical protein